MAKPALSYLPETSDEAKKANLAYQEALSRLTQTLDARKNQTFDPVMMAMAAGFLGPTTTGSFGEALGRAAGQVSKAQEAQYGQDIEAAKAQMELAQSGLQLQRQRGLDQATRQWLQGRGGQPTTTLMQPGGVRPEGQPSGGLPPGRSAAPSGGLRVMDPDPTWTTQEEYVAMNQNSGKPLGELLAEYQEKFGKHRFIRGEGGNMVDRQTGMLVPTTTGPNVTRQIIGLEDTGPIEMSQYNAMRLDEARRKGDPVEYYRIAEEITGKTGLVPKTVAEKPAGSPAGAPPSTGEPPPITRKPGAPAEGAPSGRAPGIRSKADIAAEEAATTEAARERAKSQEAQRRELMQRGGNTARNSIATANILTSFASMPDAKEMFGLASQGNLLPNIVGLLQAGIGLPGGSINIAGLEDFYRNQKLQPEQLERYRAALQQMRTMNIAMSEYAKGSVSNYEQGLFGEASINERDLPGTILLKAEALRARAEFDKEIAELARRNPKMNVEQIKDLGGYKIAEDKLNTRYRDLILKKPEFFKDPAFVDAAKQGKPELISYDRPLPGSQSKGTSLYDAFKQKSSKPK
jgi:hypothetical protein